MCGLRSDQRLHSSTAEVVSNQECLICAKMHHWMLQAAQAESGQQRARYSLLSQTGHVASAKNASVANSRKCNKAMAVRANVRIAQSPYETVPRSLPKSPRHVAGPMKRLSARLRAALKARSITLRPSRSAPDR